MEKWLNGRKIEKYKGTNIDLLSCFFLLLLPAVWTMKCNKIRLNNTEKKLVEQNKINRSNEWGGRKDMERKCYKLASCALNSIELKVYLQISSLSHMCIIWASLRERFRSNWNSKHLCAHNKSFNENFFSKTVPKWAIKIDLPRSPSKLQRNFKIHCALNIKVSSKIY